MVNINAMFIAILANIIISFAYFGGLFIPVSSSIFLCGTWMPFINSLWIAWSRAKYLISINPRRKTFPACRTYFYDFILRASCGTLSTSTRAKSIRAFPFSKKFNFAYFANIFVVFLPKFHGAIMATKLPFISSKMRKCLFAISAYYNHFFASHIVILNDASPACERLSRTHRQAGLA